MIVEIKMEIESGDENDLEEVDEVEDEFVE